MQHSLPAKKCRSHLNSAPEFLLREKHLILLLMSYVGTGLFFMLVPGTLVGVWNLLGISHSQSSSAASAAWVEAHGHAQLFGWITTFILGIGYYSLPNLRKLADARFFDGWTILVLWTMGVSLRFGVTLCPFMWQVLLPLSAVLELSAVVCFIGSSIRGHRAQKHTNRAVDSAALAVVIGSVGLLCATTINLWQAFCAAWTAQLPAMSAAERLTVVTFAVWTFILPVAWGLTAKWMPAFLGLRQCSGKGLLAATTLNFFSAVAFASGAHLVSAVGIVISVLVAIASLKLFHPPVAAAKITGVHSTFPLFVRLAYVWLAVSALLGLLSAVFGDAAGFAGASRHAVTVGFMSTLVFAVGPRVLPSFLGRTYIFSSKLMFAALLLLTGGCALRVFSQVAAYEGFLGAAWRLLPVSAVIELSAVLVFVVNMLLTFGQRTHVDQLLE